MSKHIPAPITGKMWKLLVDVGDAFAAGANVAILESMKMEIPVEAERGGVVETILIGEGELVEEGEPILSYR